MENKRYCVNCGNKLEENWHFCKKCGNEIYEEKTLLQNNVNDKKSKHSKKFFISIIVIFIIFALAIDYYLFDSNLFHIESYLSKRDIENVKDSVVMLKIYDKDNIEISTGSGFCIYQNNYILTNYHVIEGAYKITITTDDMIEYDVTDILIFNGKNDLALLKGNFNLIPLQISSSNTLKAGDAVTAIGSPKGELNTVSTGVISNCDDDYQIRITAPISPGSSGGVLLDKYNQVIGITYATYDSEDSQNINYAINVKYANDLMSRYETNNYSTINQVEDFYSNISLTPGFKLIHLKNSFADDNKYYHVQSKEIFYEVTNTKARFEYAISDSSWKTIYSSMTTEEKYDVVYKAIEIADYVYLNGILGTANKINNLTVEELIVKLGVLEKYQYAIMLIDLTKYTSPEKQFEKINSYDLSDGQKLFIKCTICNYNWNNLSSNDKNILFNYICSLISNTEVKKAVLEMFGYEVKISENGNLRAYWN